MPFSEPVISEGGTYRATFESTPTQDAASIQITLTSGEWEWTSAGLDALFQTLIDVIDGSPEFEFVQASKAQNTSTTVTVTPPPEEPALEE